MLKTITCPIAYQKSKNPHKIAVLEGDKKYSYKQLDDLIVKHQKHLIEAYQGDLCVFIDKSNSVESIIILLACLRVGKLVCLLNTYFSKARIKQLKGALRTIILDNISDLDVRENQEVNNICLSLDSVASVLLTSGSMGSPKFVLHSLANHYYSAMGSNAHIPITEGDRWLLSLPMYHVSGLSIVFRTFFGGATLVLEEASITESIESKTITHISLIPKQLRTLIKGNGHLDSLKSVLIGGDKISNHLVLRAIEKGLPLYLSYGLTEMSSQVATSVKIKEISDFKKVRSLKYTEIKINDKMEICVRGKVLFQGYLSHGGLEEGLEEGWFRTGDLGILDEGGNLAVIGRKDNMFISWGENIQPEEIEMCIEEIEGVDVCKVIPVKDKEFSYRPVAFIKGVFAKDEIVQYLLDRLEKFKIPIKFYPMPEGQGLKITREELLKSVL